jgi:drug/metabolite transporter (DMT)-like permease
MDPQTIGVGAALISAASWAAGAVLFKRISETVTPFGMTLTKSVMGLLLLGIALGFTGCQAVSPGNLALLVLSGLLGIAVADTLFFAALRDLGPNVLVVFLMIGQVLTAVLAVIFLREAPHAMAWAGILLTLGGIGAVLWTRFSTGQEKQATTRRGISLGLLFTGCMSVSWVIVKPALGAVDTLWATFIRMAAGALGILVFGAATGRLAEWMNPLQDLKLAGFFLCSVCVVTFGGFWLGLAAIKYVDLVIATSLSATEPLFVLPLAFLFLKERATPLQIAGTLVAVCGVVLIYCYRG